MHKNNFYKTRKEKGKSTTESSKVNMLLSKFTFVIIANTIV